MKLVVFVIFLQSFLFADRYVVKYLTLNEAVEYSVAAGKAYGASPLAIFIIGNIESGHNVFAFNGTQNKNKTADMGIMQVNSLWLPTLRRHGLDDPRRIYDPKYNIFVGAWVLKQCINRFGETWKSIDCYNKGPGNARNDSTYVQRFIEAYKKIPPELAMALTIDSARTQNEEAN